MPPSSGYCPVCGERCSTTLLNGRGSCVDHGWVWVEWTPPIIPDEEEDDDDG